MKNDSLAILDEYDRAWSSNSQPDLAATLRKLGVRNPSSDALPESALELFTIALEKAWKLNASKFRTAEDYINEFRGIQTYELKLIVAEFKIRHQHGDAPELAEYRKRFPQLWDRLKGMLNAVESSLAPIVVLSNNTNSPGSMPPPPGFDRFEYIGQGGMGIVYRARETHIGRDVAVKVLHPKYPATSPIAKRFIREARITGQLQHPGIPPIYSIGKWNKGRPYLSMKLIKGRTLDELLRQPHGRFNPIAVFAAICQAVGYAHSRSVIHRDLKPANIMVGKFGEIQVMDWGLAKHLSEKKSANDHRVTSIHPLQSGQNQDSTGTQIGLVLGTPAYLAPEQAQGDPDKIDKRSDVFGLGAILCELLIGRPPYSGNTRESLIASAIRGDTHEALQLLDRSGRDPELIALCKQCLMLRPDDRPADGNAVARSMSRIQDQFDTRIRSAQFEQAKRSGASEARKKLIRQTKWKRVLLIGWILFGLIGYVAGAWAGYLLLTGSSLVPK